MGFLKKYWFQIGLFVAIAVLLWLEMDNIKNWLGIAPETKEKPATIKPGTTGNTGTQPPKAIRTDYSTHPTYGKLVDKERVLYNGIKNSKNEVERLQVYLAIDGKLPESGIDGIFGQKTADALFKQKGVYHITLKDYEK